MESLNVVIAEIVICLIVAWILGFLAAWVLFRRVQKEYELELEELEDNLAYSSACSKNQEREITQQTLKIQEYEKILNANNKIAEPNGGGENTSVSRKMNGSKRKRVSSGQENEILKMIEANLDTVNKNRLS